MLKRIAEQKMEEIRRHEEKIKSFQNRNTDFRFE